MKNSSANASPSTGKTLILKVVKTDVKTAGIAPVGLSFQHR